MNNHVRATLLKSSRLASRNVFLGLRRRGFADGAPLPPQKEPSRAGAFYKSFGSPILKCFLGALFTYQLTYYCWMKLETLEEKLDKEDEIRGLKIELARLVKKREEAERLLQQGGDEKVEKSVKKGWL